MRISFVVALAAWVGALASTGCSNSTATAAAIVTGGDPARGMSAISRYGCGSCHTIAGLSSAHGLVGPPLIGIRNRMYIAGMLPNTPANIGQWIYDPKSINPKTLMPKIGLSRRDATDIAAYLYSK